MSDSEQSSWGGEKLTAEKILLIEDEKNIYELLRYNLQKEGYELLWAQDGQVGLDLFAREKPDLILLDLMLPGIDGLEVCKQIRAKTGYAVPIIILTARGDEVDKVVGLEMGADDYITKPFSNREVLARVKAALRRKDVFQAQDVLKRGFLELKPDEFQAYYHQEELTLTTKEFALLYYLCKNPGKVVTREEALQEIWGYDYYGDTRTVDVHIRKIRYKLEQINSQDMPVETVRGVGYRWRNKR